MFSLINAIFGLFPSLKRGSLGLGNICGFKLCEGDGVLETIKLISYATNDHIHSNILSFTLLCLDWGSILAEDEMMLIG